MLKIIYIWIISFAIGFGIVLVANIIRKKRIEKALTKINNEAIFIQAFANVSPGEYAALCEIVGKEKAKEILIKHWKNIK